MMEDKHPSSANGIGQPVRRKEDGRLVTGRGRYGDDFVLVWSKN
jgi:CO/xanthine dehydrogenase Mo-binding subunit